MDIHRITAIQRARDRLRRFAFSGADGRRPDEIAFSSDWLRDFQALKDHELVVPTAVTSAGPRFWGCRVRIDDSLGPRAVVRFNDGESDSVQLELQ